MFGVKGLRGLFLHVRVEGVTVSSVWLWLGAAYMISYRNLKRGWFKGGGVGTRDSKGNLS